MSALELPVVLPKVAGVDFNLSVSAFRDYRKCPAYYKYKRVDKLPEPETHHMAAGNLVHSAFYMAYGFPITNPMPEPGDHRKTLWQVSGDFKPQDALSMFDALWWRNLDGTPERYEDKLDAGLIMPFALLADELKHVKNFTQGQKKALKGPQDELRRGWHQHFREMLQESLKTPLKHPVIDIERKLQFEMGGLKMVGYVDLVLDASKEYSLGAEVFVDLKSGYTKPSDAEVFFDDQVATYYFAGGARDIWLYHMKSGEIFAVDRNDNFIASLAEMAAQDQAGIAAGYFPKRFDKEVCPRCAFRKRCHGV